MENPEHFKMESSDTMLSEVKVEEATGELENRRW